MPDSIVKQAERRLQLSFSKSLVFSGLLVGGLVMGAHRLMLELPDRSGSPDAVAAVAFTPVELATVEATPLRLAGAWRLTSSERRVGGLSALAMDAGGLIALSDSGVMIRLPRPGSERSVALVRDLPDGPGDPRRKSRRDSEALARLADGDWLVGFENRDQIWRYDPAFRSGRRVVRFTNQGWPTNRGIEAMAIDRDGGLIVIPENRGSLTVLGDVDERYPLASDGWTVSDATRLPDGRLFVLLRRITLFGFRNAIGELVRGPAGWRVEVRATLPLGGLDNAEGLAAERMPGGGTRLWVATDDDFAFYRRTLLLAFDLPAKRPAG